MENKKIKIDEPDRIKSVMADYMLGVLISIVLLIVVLAVSGIVGYSDIVKITIIGLEWLSFFSILIQPLCLFIFKKSWGTKLTKIEIKNVDGTEASRIKYFISFVIYVILFGVYLFLLLTLKDNEAEIFGAVIFILVLVDYSIISKTERTLVDRILGLKAYKISEDEK